MRQLYVVSVFILLWAGIAFAGPGSEHYRSGMAAFDRGDFTAAVIEFRQAVTAEPNNAQYRYRLGAAYYHAGSYDYAKTVLIQAKSMAPKTTIASDAQALLNLIAQGQRPSSSSVQRAPGGVRGTVVYYFNENFGRKPDVGADAWVVAGSRAAPKTYSDVLDIIGHCVKSSKADGNGVYQIDGLQPGVYTVLLESSHSKGSTKLDAGGKVYSEVVTVKSGQFADVSHDFGISAW